MSGRGSNTRYLPSHPIEELSIIPIHENNIVNVVTRSWSYKVNKKGILGSSYFIAIDHLSLRAYVTKVTHKIFYILMDFNYLKHTLIKMKSAWCIFFCWLKCFMPKIFFVYMKYPSQEFLRRVKSYMFPWLFNVCLWSYHYVFNYHYK